MGRKKIANVNEENNPLCFENFSWIKKKGACCVFLFAVGKRLDKGNGKILS